ncbi:MAG: ribonuclease HII [Halobacteriales archaeon]
MAICGVDEAGKGPVLGSMFVAAVRVTDPTALPAGIADSKQLTPAQREEFAARLRATDAVTIGVAEITPDRIDAPQTDMNTLTVAGHAEALTTITTDGDRVVVDAGDVDAARFARRVTGRVDTDIELTAEHGADDRHAIVGAASVIAKVERDAHIETLAEEYGAIGSGYPSDPTTREFLKEYVDEHGTLPACARGSWQTAKDVLGAADQTALDQF